MEIEFLFKNIECKKYEKLEDIYNKFTKNQLLDFNKMLFYYNQKLIEPKYKISNLASREDLNRKNMTFILEEKNKKFLNAPFSNPKEVICPKCGENALINIDNYKISISCLKNKHKLENISLEDFYTCQKKGFSNIFCHKCYSKNRNNTYNNEFFICNDCNKNLCYECKLLHDKNHNIIKYIEKYNYCGIHYKKKYKSYCERCKTNLCIDCERAHKYNHNIIQFKQLLKNEDYLKYEFDDIKNKKNQLINKIEKLKTILNDVIDNMNIYYKIHENIFNNYKKNKNNYEALLNINEITKNIEMKHIDELLREKDIKEQFNLIYDIYEQMNEKKEKFIYSKPKIEDNNKINERNNDSSISSNYREDNSSSTAPWSRYLNNDNSKSNYTRNKTKNIKPNQRFISNEEEEKQNNDKSFNKYKYSYINKKRDDDDSDKNRKFEDNYGNKAKEKKYQISCYKNIDDKDSDSNESIKIDGDELNELNNEMKSVLENNNSIKQKQLDSFRKYRYLDNLKNKSSEEMSIETKEKYNKYNNQDKPKGLYNLGLSCYMNSLLQCLYYIPELREYFIDPENNFNDEQPVCQALSEVMYELKYSENDNIEANMFKTIMGEKNGLFAGKKAGDAKDLFFNLIDSLLSELTKEKEEETEKYLDLTNKKDVFREACKEVDKNIINELFIGYYETAYKCKKYHKAYVYSFSSESFILFNLEKIKEYCNKDILSIEECLNYNFKRKNNNTSFYCSQCNGIEINVSKEKIYKPPKILVLILDRGHGKTFKGEVNFKTNLDLYNYLDEKDKYYTEYNLIGVSTHSGTSSSSGHYTACCLTDNGEYYYFSDTHVEPINENVIYENEPYLLFYKRIDS